jgi:hypothetical protein
MDFEATQFRFNPKPMKGLHFELSGTTPISFFMKSKQPDIAHYEYWDPYLVQLSCEIDASDDAFEFVKRLQKRELYQFGEDRIELPRIVRGETKIAKNGQLAEGYYPRLDICPSEIQDLVTEVERKLQNAAKRVLGLISWQQRLKSEWKLNAGSLYWGPSGAPECHGVPDRINPPLTTGTLAAVECSSEAETQLLESWSIAGLDEPLGHVLLREARALLGSSPRSALVLMAAALEVGVKTHCSQIAPSTSWIFENLPSPPIFKIIKDYLPTLRYEHPQTPKFWHQMAILSKTTQIIFETRNKVVHTGSDVDTSKLEDFFVTALDVLYLLDVLSGHDWAKVNVSEETARDLDWPIVRVDRKFTWTILE